jgi:hypothetical protein
LDHLSSYNSLTNTIEVMFGEPVNLDTLNGNKGVCVMKLPPSAHIDTDSKYNLTGYSGNPCIELYDNSVAVSPVDGYCKFQNYVTGPGSVCQFSRIDDSTDYNPLPCSTDTETYEGNEYKLECLINDNLTETVRNNPNFLNSSYAGVCAYPVHDKFKTCELYNNNCRPPYVCTEVNEGFFCDSRFDVLQCKNVYACPPTYSCQDGVCLSNSGGYCVDDDNCANANCNTSKLVLGLFNSIDTGELIKFDLNMSGTTAKDYKLYVSSRYDNNALESYVFLYKDSNNYKLVKISDPLGTPVITNLTVSNIGTSTDFTFDHVNQNLYGFTKGSNLSLRCIFSPGTAPTLASYSVSNIIDIDIDNNRLLVTTQSTRPSSRPQFINLDLTTDNTQNNEYSVTLFDDMTQDVKKVYTLPYYSQTLDDLIKCKFDLLNLNDTELDIVCTHNPENFESPILGVRHKVRSVDKFQNNPEYFSSLFEFPTHPNCPDDIGCFKTPVISDLKQVQTLPTGITGTYVYVVNNKADINTIYAFSNKAMTVGGQTVNKIYKQSSSLYLGLSGTPTEPYTVSPSLSDYAPFSFSSTSNLDNYGNVMSKYLEYPYWITDLQDLIVGDNFNPNIKRIFYQPDRVNKNFYAIVDMYTGYTDPIENTIIASNPNITDTNTYLFKFSSLNNDIGYTVNETVPIRVFGPTDITRFSQCNQTQNMYFLSNMCN